MKSVWISNFSTAHKLGNENITLNQSGGSEINQDISSFGRLLLEIFYIIQDSSIQDIAKKCLPENPKNTSIIQSLIDEFKKLNP